MIGWLTHVRKGKHIVTWIVVYNGLPRSPPTSLTTTARYIASSGRRDAQAGFLLDQY